MTYTDRTDEFVASLGFEAYRVGGSVRDQLLGRRSKDGDYVVRAELDALRGALVRVGGRPTPIKDRKDRQLGFRANRKGLGLVEIVLPRTERKVAREGAGNERHAFEIVIDPALPLEDDARRRDLTMNAIYIDVKSKDVVDPLNGISDLRTGTVRTTYEGSFSDDPLRIMRALRFVSTLGFGLADDTFEQMQRYADAMGGGLTDKGVSGTALDELCKLLMGNNVVEALRLARDTGALVSLLPELAPMIGFPGGPYHSYTVDEHTFMALDAAARMHCSLRVRMALLFHDAGKPETAWIGDDGFIHFYASGKVEHHVLGDGEFHEWESRDHATVSAQLLRKALARLNAEKALRRDAPLIVEWHMLPLTMKVKPTKVRKWRCEIGDDLLADLFKHRLADIMGKETVDYEALSAIARMEKIREEAVLMKVPASPKDLKDAGLIDGNDLKAMGIEGGKIGKILNTLLHEVVSQPDRAEREWLLSRAKRLAAKV